MPSEGKSALFVCLGNICRSPLAEAVFAHLVQERNLQNKITRIDSAGTAGYHVGEEPDDRSTAVCRKHGVKIDSTCRQLVKQDFHEFDVIVGMDNQNMTNIEKIRPKPSKAHVALFGSYGDGKVIVDPYYGKDDGFERVYQQCLQYSEGLLKELLGDGAGGGIGAGEGGKL